ncbi:hypothetical protein [Paenibacillus polymyxa]|uniref:hypothetical protein n=1 Tax=Paenibacillus polymyxa TaxID=1406 RepID=UPI002AB53545|nr:hypothetical protein [Paenibacillus polymyxa]MDY8023356.1 hypothetical protein [Paenibacillus polymyxa]
MEIIDSVMVAFFNKDNKYVCQIGPFSAPPTAEMVKMSISDRLPKATQDEITYYKIENHHYLIK